MSTQTHPVAFLLGLFMDVLLSVSMPISILIIWRLTTGPLGIVESTICVVVGLVSYIFARGIILPRQLFVSQEDAANEPERPPPPE